MDFYITIIGHQQKKGPNIHCDGSGPCSRDQLPFKIGRVPYTINTLDGFKRSNVYVHSHTHYYPHTIESRDEKICIHYPLSCYIFHRSLIASPVSHSFFSLFSLLSPFLSSTSPKKRWHLLVHHPRSLTTCKITTH